MGLEAFGGLHCLHLRAFGVTVFVWPAASCLVSTYINRGSILGSPGSQCIIRVSVAFMATAIVIYSTSGSVELTLHVVVGWVPVRRPLPGMSGLFLPLPSTPHEDAWTWQLSTFCCPPSLQGFSGPVIVHFILLSRLPQAEMHAPQH